MIATENKFPSRQTAEQLLKCAEEKNPGPWANHCRIVGRATETISKHCGLNKDIAYVLGLLHDIGRYEGVRGLHHIYAGYELMLKNNYVINAQICLTHSFPYQNFGAYSGGDIDCTSEEISIIKSFLSQVVYDDYDKLIQLCDCIGSAQGVCLMEVRFLDVLKRYGVNDFSMKKWESLLYLKKYFDSLCGINIYDLFYEEIRSVSFY